MIPTTPFEHEIIRRVRAGELCPTVLDHGDFCGREIDKGHGVGLCQWHSEELLGLPHHGEESDHLEGKNVCTRCHKRPVQFRVSRLCGICRKSMHRQHLVSNLRREKSDVAVGYIVEL